MRRASGRSRSRRSRPPPPRQDHHRLRRDRPLRARAPSRALPWDRRRSPRSGPPCTNANGCRASARSIATSPTPTPAAAARLHPHDTVRIVRALEVLQVTGRPISAWQAEHGFRDGDVDVLVLGVSRPREELHARIATRCRAMVDAGLLDEIRALWARGFGPAPAARQRRLSRDGCLSPRRPGLRGGVRGLHAGDGAGSPSAR